MNKEHKRSFGIGWDSWLMALAFVLWAIMFRAYLSGKVALFDDAVSYYDHIKFYLDSISKGVFPLWDPLWFCGGANAFFLQRMGCFNPLLLTTLVFKTFGFSYTTSYLLYLMLYYFVGCTGFYLLARAVIKNRVCAFAAFVLLLFSALGTRSFDSFMVLMFTPMVWFFYFLVSFSQKPGRFAFAGMFFSLIIVATTYIPFYFLLSVVSFAVCFAVLYAGSLKGLLAEYVRFVFRHKFLTLLCVSLLCLSLVPGYLFFKSGGKGDYVMPKRNTNQEVGSVLGVQAQDSPNSWALLEELFFAKYYYTDITQIKFAVIYVPLLAWIIFFLGFAARVNKKVLLLFLWIAGLLLICIPKASPVYALFYDHVPVFKYFRNLHFYLWVTILPALCLMLGEQLRSLLAWKPSGAGQRVLATGWIVLVHGALAMFLWRVNYPVETSFYVLILSAVFFVWRLWGTISRRNVLAMALLLVIAALEPWQIYGYLSQNTRPYFPYAYAYDSAPTDFRYTRGNDDIELVGIPQMDEADDSASQGRVVRSQEAFYYASKWFTYLSANVDMYVLRKYRSHKFVVYDAVERLDDGDMDFDKVETALAENRNVAFVSTDDPGVIKYKPNTKSSYYARRIEGPAPDFQVKAYSANMVRLKTNFSRPQFVVYNDNYHREWRAIILGKEFPVIRSNVAFKGIWVPAGEQTVEFKFGLPGTWLIYMGLFAGINILFVALFMLAWRGSKCDRKAYLPQDSGASP